MSTIEADDCPIETVFADGRVPCTLPRNHPPPHAFGDTLLPFADEEAAPEAPYARLVAAALDRAEAAEAKLAAIGTYCREHKGDAGFSWLHAGDIKAIIDGEEKT